jgi:hypothetical protein
MDDNKYSKTLIVYAPQQNIDRILSFKNSILKFDAFLGKSFLLKRRLILLAVTIFSLFFLMGNCFAAYYIEKLPYILDLFFDKCYIKAFLITFSFIFASGYTIFGSFLSVCFFALFSFISGSLIFSCYTFNGISIKFIVFSILIALLIFCCSIFCIESFSYYKNNKCHIKILFTKSSLCYFLSSIASVIVMYICFSLINIYFW